MGLSDPSAHSEGSPPARFDLPSSDVAPGRSQPKRSPPKRRVRDPRLLRRIALSVAIFLISLALVTGLYHVLVSAVFGGIALENGTTAAVALLIGCFTLPTAQRKTLTSQQHLIVCLVLLATTPWTYQYANQLDDAGVDLANGFNFLFEILFAVVLYQLTRRWQPAADETAAGTSPSTPLRAP